MSPRQPRRHHTVPRLYQRAFADGKQVLWRTRAGSDELRNIERVAFAHHFYAFGTGSERDVSVETWLHAHVEDPAAPALRRVFAGTWPPAGDDREVLTRYLAFQVLRTPLIRRFMLQIGEHTAPLFWSAEVLHRALREGDLSDEEKRDLLVDARRRRPPELFDDDPKPLLRTMLREADRLIPLLVRRGWSLFRSDERCLVAGDNPAVRVFPAGDPAGFTGLVPADADLHLPLSPSTLLVLEGHGRPAAEDVGVLTPELVAVTNAAQARWADVGVLRHPAMPWPSGLLLGPVAPRLPTPQVTTTFGSPGPSTFPATYPPANDPAVAALLTELGAVDTVE